MARTPLVRALRATLARAGDARTSRARASALAGEGRGPGGSLAISRREFLRGVGVLGAGLALMGGPVRCSRPPEERTTERVVIVGAGLAGLACARRLAQAGVRSEIHEASDRAGGRCLTLRGFFGGGQYAELGGEFIDSNHAAIRRLAGELGLGLTDLRRAEAGGLEALYHFDGGTYGQEEALEDLRDVLPAARADARVAGYPTRQDKHTERGYELDHTSVAEWIEENVPGGASSKLGGLLSVAYTTEYGIPVAEQSALNLVYFLGYSPPNAPRLYGSSDERYTITGGNGLLVDALTEGLGDAVRFGSELVSLRRRADGSYELTFQEDSGAKELGARRVVLALPFSVMRTSVDYSRAGFGPLKERAIGELGMGTNSKLLAQFGGRTWRERGLSGETYSDTGYQLTWEASAGQPGAEGILVDYTGGGYGESFGSGTAGSLARRFLSQIEPVMPGLAEDFGGKARVAFWPGNPWSRGSYSGYEVGQYTGFSGVEGEREGNCHFAGEHTIPESQGYLNGAVESGERAAMEILRDLR